MKKILILAFSLYSLSSFCQNTNSPIIKEILEKVKEHYVDKDLYKKLDSEVQLKNLESLNGKNLAEELTKQLTTISQDQHFFVKYLENFNPEKQKDAKEILKSNNFHNSLENFGFENVRRLDGNIGYINFKGFAEPSSSSKTLESAMNFVANTNSLIIDLRENRGGDNGMLLLFCSYFFKDKANLYSTYFRDKGKTVENNTESKVSGQKYLNKKIYILTSKYSFSAAEGLAYFLKAYQLAQVIGENTGGAANPVDEFIIGNKYLLVVPVGKITAKKTVGNWEHTGVSPDIKTTSEKAFKTAHLLALKDILKNKVQTELSENELENLIRQLEKE
ncbi:S41 family peptidase [Chryseobacterium paridis]|uniref:S41 family peptidase n=1 Tax=Chryseobacterium paridis TaxID=2800328 RepID=A0ABS1FWJ2_9FLAO|nr:S41 family peptidase [Chryseobacterium paridis]MBK1896584.1 S41 family peptidase [Chryseobacterium paridis]